MKSQRLSYRDMREILGLVSEVSELGLEPDQWRRHLLQGAMRLTHANVGLTTDLTNLEGPGQPRMVDLIDIGWGTDRDRQTFYRFAGTEEFSNDPAMRSLKTAYFTRPLSTAYRQQWIDDKTWYDAPAVSEFRRATDVDGFLCSAFRLRKNAVTGIVLYRPWAAQSFNDRDRRIVRLLHAHIVRLIHVGMNDPLARAIISFPPRVRETLSAARDGLSDKEIAERLGISTHTVHDYMKAIFRTTGISSRTRLICVLLTRLRTPIGILLPPPLELPSRQPIGL